MAYYITDAESLPQMPLGKLTAKDRILVLSGSQASIPVTLFGLLKDLKVEFVTVPGMEGEEDPFTLGYLFGYYAAQATPGEQIKLYNRGAELIPTAIRPAGQKKKQPAPKQEGKAAQPEATPKKPETKPVPEQTKAAPAQEPEKAKTAENSSKKASQKANPGKGVQKPQEEPFGELTRFLSNEEPKTPQKASEKGTEKAAEKSAKKNPEKPAEGKKKSGKKPSLSEQLALVVGKADDLAFILKTVKGREFMLEECITQSTDAEIGYKMKLEMFFGPSAGGRIWELTKAGYEKMKKAL